MNALPLLFLSLLWVVGCAPLQRPGPGDTKPGAPSIETEEPSGSSLEDEVLYQILVGELAGQRGRFDVAVPEYLRAARESRDPAVAARALAIANFAGDAQASRTAVALWRTLAPADPKPMQVSALLWFRAGEDQRVFADLRELIAASPNPGAGFGRVLHLFRKHRDKGRVMALFRRLVEAFPGVPEGPYALALTAFQTGDPQAALVDLRQALKLRPDWVKARLLEARILTSLKRGPEAVARLQSLVREHPQDYRVRLTYGRNLLANGEFDKAREQFQKLLQANPNDEDVVYGLALLEIQMGDLTAAEGLLKKLADGDRYRDEAAYYLGQIAERSQRLGEARKWYGRVRGGEFELPATIRRLLLEGKGGQLGRARTEFAQLRAANPKLVGQLYLVEGELLTGLGRLQEAKALYDEGLVERPDNRDLLYARGLLGDQMGRVDLLERDMSRLLELDPDNADALNALGYTLADRTDRLQEARKYLTRALALKPDNAAVMDSMGWLQYRLGHLAAAERYLRKALAGLADAEIASHLGEVLLVRGKREEARAVVSRALQSDPDSPLLQRVWQWLETGTMPH